MDISQRKLVVTGGRHRTWWLKVGSIRCPETTVISLSMMRMSHLHRDGSLQSLSLLA